MEKYLFSTHHISTTVQFRDLNLESLERGEIEDYFGEKSLPSLLLERNK